MKKESFFASLFFDPKKVIKSIQSKIESLEKETVRIGKGLYLDVQFLLPITTSMI